MVCMVGRPADIRLEICKRFVDTVGAVRRPHTGMTLICAQAQGTLTCAQAQGKSDVASVEHLLCLKLQSLTR